ncbi:N-acetylmuramoyl-L-alanine amidase [Frankliniella fusca]|uniref:N-acetylmuramoyl-L-alanine amidase n=1 Tax=Frankliniella fusca TaxID=407009 RepID=A0AAE1I4M7_9NEOP|nr:N-acetylmuramoyl-L-alanine amidase [Frankliniella fusca]
MGQCTRRRWPPGPAIASSLLVLTVTFMGGVAQENAGMTIPPSLIECYSNASLLSGYALPNFGIGQLIELIRKVENSQYGRLDLKNMAVQLTHRFRQDGVRRNPQTMASEGVIPYTPSGPEFFRHSILLKMLIPGNAYNFPNASLTTAEQCAMHFMLSSTVDDIQRTNEDSECNNLRNYETDVSGSSTGGGSSGTSGYRQPGGGGYSAGVNWNSRRFPQQATRGPRRNREARAAGAGLEADVEILDPTLQQEVAKSKSQYVNYQRSRCPIQGGVVFTPWGGVSAGTVIAGIAAGLVPQQVSTRDLAVAIQRSKYFTGRVGRPGMSSADTLDVIDNKWAATFSGDLAQVALLQGPQDPSRMAVGLAAGWTSTLDPKKYYLSQTVDAAMSEANVRGCIDGLVLGTGVNDWYSRSRSNLRLSQLLDMYYSERGVFGRNNRACLRRERVNDVASTNTMDTQTEAFAKFYGPNNPLSVTLSDDVITTLSDTAVSRLQSFIPTLNDPTCAVGTTSLMVRPYVNLIINMDLSYQYQDIHPVISYLLEKLEAGQYGSNVTILNAKDGSVVFNSSYPRLDWSMFNSDAYSNARARANGFDLQVSLSTTLSYLRLHDTDLHRRRVLTGRGQAVLYLTQALGSYDQMRIYTRYQNFRALFPDVDTLVLTSGNRNGFGVLTNDTNRDVFAFTVTDPASGVRPLVERIKTVPRRIRNANCDADWVQDGSGNGEFVDYVEPLGVNYYRLAPNNFYRVKDEYARVRVQGQGYGTLTVCYSRTLPAMNGTQNTFASQAGSAGTCQQLTTGNVEIPIANLCADASYVKDCAPLYIAVSASQAAQTADMRCNEDACRFPDMLKYTVILERAGCWSAAGALHAAGLLTALLAVLPLLLQFNI